MALRKQFSEWRQKRVDWHGEELYRDLKKKFSNQSFNIPQVAQLPSLSHLAESTSYDIATAVCQHLVLKGKIKRQGQMMRLVRVK